MNASDDETDRGLLRWAALRHGVLPDGWIADPIHVDEEPWTVPDLTDEAAHAVGLYLSTAAFVIAALAVVLVAIGLWRMTRHG